MGIVLVLGLSLIPGGLLAAIQKPISHAPSALQGVRRRLWLYLGIFMVLWFAVIAPFQPEMSSFIGNILLPFIVSLIPATWLLIRSSPGLINGRTAIGLGVYGLILSGTTAAIVLFAIQRQELLFERWIGIGAGVIVAVVWDALHYKSWWARPLYLVCLFLSFALNVSLVWSRNMEAGETRGLENAGGMMALVALPTIFAAMVGYAVFVWHVPSTPHRWQAVLRVILPAIVVAAPFYFVVAETLLLDRATDGISGLMAVIAYVIVVYAVATLLLLLQGWSALPAISLYLVLMIFAGYGTILLDSNRNPREVTAERAANIDAAIQDYADREGAYPLEIADLVPRDLLFLPRPALFRDQQWCYQSSGDAYRLGYVYRPTWGVPAEAIEIRIQGSAGPQEQISSVCESMLEQYQERYGIR
jgi:hypothetical protein